jgi:RND family efflux transporter MFP subunit
MYKKIRKKYSELSKRNKRLIILIEAILLVALLIFGKDLLFKKENEFETTRVSRQNISTTVSASGTVEAQQQANLHFQSLGKVSWVGVVKGDRVNKWQALAKLDTVQLNTSLQIAHSNLRGAEATLERVYDDVKDHDDDESFTQKETRTTAEIAKDNAYEAVVSAQKAIVNSTLIAPFSGVVVSVSDNMTPGTNIALTDIITIADTSKFKFTAQVDEVDYGQIEVGEKVEISLDAFPDEVFEGTVSYISEVGIKTAGGGVTVPIDIEFDTNGNSLAINLGGDVEFNVEEKENVLVVPREYVKTKNGESIVYVLKERNRSEERVVKTGLNTLFEVEIMEGLIEGEEIVLVRNGKK